MENLLEQLEYLILKKKKDLTSKEVIELSHQLDQKIIKEMEIINKNRLNAIKKSKFDPI